MTDLPQGNSPVTVEAWIRPSDLDATILSWGPSGNYRFQLNNGKLLQTLYVEGGNADHYEEGNTNVEAFKWSHVAMSFDGDSVRFYINGALDHTAYMTSGTAPESYDILNIGRMLNISNSEAFFAGQIDEVRIWNTARSASQIAEWIVKSEDVINEAGLILSLIHI